MPIESVRNHQRFVVKAGGAERSSLIPTKADSDNLMKGIGFERSLASAAAFYDISKDVKDYLLQPVPIIWSDLSNRNGIGFPLQQLVAWIKEKGCMAYQGWRGQAVRVEHDWEGEVIGIIPDVIMRPLRGFAGDRLYKVIVLNAVDRSKNPKLAAQIDNGERNTWSMGCLVEKFSCSICGSFEKSCKHLREDENFRVQDGLIAHRNAHGIIAEECSSVADPAYGQAVGDVVIRYAESNKARPRL